MADKDLNMSLSHSGKSFQRVTQILGAFYFLFKSARLVMTKVKKMLKIEKCQTGLNILHTKRKSTKELSNLCNGNDCIHIALFCCCKLKYHQWKK